MQSAAEAVKETASNIAASAKSGMDKTMAVVEEKVERMTAHDPLEKEMARQRKEEKILEAELNKQQIYHQNAAARLHAGTVSASSGKDEGQSTGLSQMSALPGHGTGEPEGGYIVEGVVETHPTGINTGTGQTIAKNPRASADVQGYDCAGGGYT